MGVCGITSAGMDVAFAFSIIEQPLSVIIAG